MAQPQAAQPLLIGLFLNTACLLQTSALLGAKRSSGRPCSVQDPNLQHSKRREEASLLQSSTVLRGNASCRCWELLAVPEPCFSMDPAAQHQVPPQHGSSLWQGTQMSTERSYLLLSAGAWGWQSGPTEQQ